MNRIRTTTMLVSMAILTSACSSSSARTVASAAEASTATLESTPVPAIGSPAATAPLVASPTPASVLPGEPWIAYEGPIPGGAGNRLVRPDGQEDHWATPDVPRRTDGWQVHPDWSPDGTRLAFAVDDTDGSSRDLWISEPDGANAERVFDCQSPCIEADAAAWSPDGRTLAFVAMDGDGPDNINGRLMVLDLQTRAASVILRAPKVAEFFRWPRWSPDGRSIVLELQRWSDKGPTGVLSASIIGVVDMTAKTPTMRPFTEWSLFATYPDWHPSQDLIVFSTRQWDDLATGPSNLYTVRPDGTEMTQLTHFKAGQTRATQPTWLPDGSGIIFTAVEGDGFGNPTMATILPDGTGLTSATSNEPMLGTHPRLRPMP